MATATVPAGRPSVSRRLASVMRPLPVVWRELGAVGRLAAAGLVASGVVAVLLGTSIHASVRHHQLEVRAELIERIVDGLTADGLLPIGSGDPPPEAVLDAAVEHRLIGGEIVGVTVRDASGADMYSDGDRPSARERTVVDTEAHVEQHDDGLLHFRIPIDAPDGHVVGTFEVFQRGGSFEETLARVRRNLWLSITTGLTSLGVAMGAFTLSHARALDRRRRHAERLLRELLVAEDEERRRVVGSLHDDIGQPLYRLLYGLEGCRSRVETEPAVAEELERLGGLVRDIDLTLRGELHRMHRSSFDELDLGSGLESIALAWQAEFDVVVELQLDVPCEPPLLARSVLLRAVEEGLLNVRKHARATTVRIRAVGTGQRVTVEVTDDGPGATGPLGLGLTTATERLEAIGGGLELGRARGGGTLLRVWAPASEEVAG